MGIWLGFLHDDCNVTIMGLALKFLEATSYPLARLLGICGRLICIRLLHNTTQHNTQMAIYVYLQAKQQGRKEVEAA